MAELWEQALCAEYNSFVSSGSTLQNAVYEALKKCILQAKISGEVAENQIASILNISRTPIREAMHKLAENGLLEISHGRRARIVEFSSKDISDMAVILKELHSIATVLCIEYASNEDIVAIQETMALFCFHADHDDLTAAFKYLTQFHSMVAKTSGNKWLSHLVDQLLAYTEVYRERAFKKPGRAPCARVEHMEILDAICNRDVEKAKQVLKNHVDSAYG